MTWVRVDDKALQHPKLLRAGADGVCLWLAGLCHCNSFATNGLIRKEFVDALYPLGRGVARRVAARLVAVGLWKDAGPSFEVHDYERYQAEAMKDEAEAKAAEFEARRKRDRERKRAERAGKREPVRGLSHRTNGTSPNGQEVGQSADGPMVVPRARGPAGARVSRPDPTRPDLDLGGSAEFEDVAAVSEGGTAANGTPAATAASSANGSNGEAAERVGAEDVARAWAETIAKPGANAGAVHEQAYELWRSDFKVIAAACNAEDGKPSVAMHAVIEWFWFAPDGPVQGKRMEPIAATPHHLAKRASRDLKAAKVWWFKQREAQRPRPREAMQ